MNGDDITKQIREWDFANCTTKYAPWYYCAMRHKHAADHLHKISTEGSGKMHDLLPSDWKVGDRNEMSVEMQTAISDSMLWEEYYLLAGYALECLFKGLLLERNAGQTTANGTMAKQYTSHNLLEYAEQCGLPVTDEDKLILNLLTHYIKNGKYPVPKKVKDLPGPPRNIGDRRAKQRIDFMFDNAHGLRSNSPSHLAIKGRTP
jgi:hypothetical protein